MTFMRGLTTILTALGMIAQGQGATSGQPAVDDHAFFETKVRPVLVDHCVQCHGQEKQKGGLRLDSREALLTGGESGPAVVPGKPAESLLIEAVKHEGLEMPPKGKLPDAAITALEEWVMRGVPWTDSAGGRGTGAAKKPSQIAGAVLRTGSGLTEEDRNWWAFRPVSEPEVPRVDDRGWSRNPVDAFVWNGLVAAGLTPAPEADRVILIRRLTFDLTGLPPTPAEVDAFLTDSAPDAYERLVERLLASPHYGERWARHWLDLVRYAESDGYRIDHYRPNAWLYRDYVVRAFNDDKPYDRFVREQLAGDELFPGDPDAITATGYLRHWIYEYNNRDARGQWSVVLNDITDTTGDVFLGLGLQCARCHNHKFDPILQKDYFRLQAFFAAVVPHDDRPAESAEALAQYRSRLTDWEAKTGALRTELAAIEAKIRAQGRHDAVIRFPEDVQALMNKPAGERTPQEHQIAWLVDRQVDYEVTLVEGKLKGPEKERLLALRKQLTAFEGEKPEPPDIPLSVTDVGPEAPPVVIPKRGNDPIEPGFLTILDETPAAVEPRVGTTGRRAALANWLTRSDNPLSTRVIVNRIWQYHFGRGLAANASDFGRLGEAPSHPELLDWLTARFVREGWSLKNLHRWMVNSAAYRQSATRSGASLCKVKDPENRLYWRGNTRRLDAEQIRDAVFSVTGELDTRAGGPGAAATEPRLTIYTKVLRNNRDPLLDVFDLPQFFASAASRDTTTTPLQSLLLINSQLVRLRAEALASRLEREAGDSDAARVALAYRLAFGRPPREEETSAARRFLRDQTRAIDPADVAEAATGFLHGKIPFHDGQAAVIAPKGPQRRFEVPHQDAWPPAGFTVEAFFQLRSADEGAVVRTVAAKWNGDPKSPGWAFGVTGQGSRRKPQTLVIQLYGTNTAGEFGETAVFSDQTVQLDTPYYAAVAVTPAGDGPGKVTFYLKNLANEDEPLQTIEVAHKYRGGLDNSHPLTLGGRAGKTTASFDGLIDDIRLSAGTLLPGQLLIDAEAANRHGLGHWRFEAEPGVFLDSSSRGIHIRTSSRSQAESDPRRAALADFCHVLFNTNEFLYVD